MHLLLRLIYSPIVNAMLRPFAKFIYKQTGRELFSTSGTLHFRHEQIEFLLATNQTCFVTKHMFYKGVSDYEYNWLFKDLAQNANCFLDVGANIGLYSVLAAKHNPKLEIHAFEPGIGAVHYLRQNILINQLPQVQIHEVAMSNQDGQLTFHEVSHPKFPWLQHNLNGSSSLQADYGRSKSTSYDVSVCRLQTFLDQHDHPSFDLIKLDTEHTEQLIIADSQAIFSAHRPLIMIEIYPEIADEIQTLLSGWSAYHFLRLERPKLKEIGLMELGKHATNVNYLLVPNEKLTWVSHYISE